MNPQLRRLLLDLGPLLLFFAAFKYAGFYVATGVFMVAMLVALGIGWSVERKLSPMPLFTAAMVVVFGGLTIWLQNETFLKVKVTVIYAIFSIVLLGGLATGRLFIKYVFATAFELDEAGWRKLTLRWGLFFLFVAVLNEAVWRNFSTDAWVTFKVWGVLPLLFLFALSQTPLLMKHQLPDDKPASPEG